MHFLSNHARLAVFCAATLLLSHITLRRLLTLSLGDDRYTYLLLMPLLCILLIYLDRKAVFRGAAGSPRLGGPLILLGSAVYLAALVQSWGLTGEVLGLVLSWLGGFALIYGPLPLRTAAFPLFLMLMTTPLPSAWMHWTEVMLQHGSAEVTHVLFKLTGIPVLRQGLVFSLPGIDIEVAEQCSGIRSSTAFLLMIMAISHLFLRTYAGKAGLILLTVPIVIFKNAVRITTLSWLGVYVSQDFLTGDLHRNGGLPFSLIGLALLVPSLLIVRRLEDRRPSSDRS